jgi:hypothetical protein
VECVGVCLFVCGVQTPDVSNCVQNYCYTTSTMLTACTSKEEVVI